MLQATNLEVSLCYDIRAALKKALWSLDEAKDLRNNHEPLDQLADTIDDRSSEDAKVRSIF